MHCIFLLANVSVGVSSIVLNRFVVYFDLGLGGSFRSYNAIGSSEQTVLKLEEEARQAEVDELVLDDQLGKLHSEFVAAKQGFLKIPEALKGMPKMNPKGSLMF